MPAMLQWAVVFCRGMLSLFRYGLKEMPAVFIRGIGLKGVSSWLNVLTFQSLICHLILG